MPELTSGRWWSTPDLEGFAPIEESCRRLGVLWTHDNNPKRPYARLTSGKISSGFFNGGRLMRHPKVLKETVKYLLDDPEIEYMHQLPYAQFVAPAIGAIPLAYEIATQLTGQMLYAEKDGDAFAFKREQPDFTHGHYTILVEDTITTGGSILKVNEACGRNTDSVILALCNRTGKRTLGTKFIMAVFSLTSPVWDEGNNPFTPGGEELVPPVRPKTHWNELTKEY